MVRAQRLALVLAALLAPTGVFAQAQAPTPPQKPAQPPAAQGAPAAPAGTGQKFGSWILGCPPAGQKGACVLVQQVSETLSRKVVFVWLLQYDPDGNLLGAFRLPSGVFVDRGLVMKMDGKGEGLKVNYTRCDPGECQAVFSVSESLVKQLAAAKAVSILIALTSGRNVDVQIDMAGFQAALVALAARAKGGTAQQ